MPGPPKKPTKLRIAEGSRAHRPINKNEPEPVPGMPTPPDGLLPEVVKSYYVTANELDRLGLLTLVDHEAYNKAHVCLNLAEMAQKELRRLLEKINEGKGEQQDYYKASVQNAIWSKNLASYKALMTPFGAAGPASRANLSVPSSPKGSGPHAHLSEIEKALSGLPN